MMRIFKRRKRNWMVSYRFVNTYSHGRIFLLSDDVPLTEEAVIRMEEVIRDECDGQDVFILNVVKLEVIYQ